MKACSLIMLFCCAPIYTTVDIKPELKIYILNFGYGINFQCEGMLSYSFDRFHVVTKFNFPNIDDIKL